MASTKNNQKAYANLAQIYNACSYYGSDERNVERLLKKATDINYKVPAFHFVKLEKPELLGNTALHFAFATEKLKIFDFLLSHSADYTIQNSEGLTVIHKIIRYIYRDYADPRKVIRHLECPEVNSILAAHVKDGNHKNPRDQNGISHFHAACMANNVDAVELFLNNGVPINQAVKMDSPYFAGYTALHFAVRCGSVETTRILLQRGVDVSLKDAKGMTPLQLIVASSVKIIDWISIGKDIFLKSLPSDIEVNEDLINAFMKCNSDHFDAFDDAGLSYFQAACLVKDTKMAELALEHVKDIDHYVSMASPICPGFTASHFAALFNINTLKLLLRNGANLEFKNVKGLTPFDLCLERYDVTDIHSVLSSQVAWKSISLSANKTNLLDIVFSMRHANEFESFLETTELDINAFIPKDSPLWGGYSILHLAVTLSERLKQKSNYSRLRPHLPLRQFQSCLELIKKCLDRGANVETQDCRGMTPLHLAFRQFKVNSVDLLSQPHIKLTNIVDKDGLSHLHIACAANNVTLVEHLLSNGADVDSPVKCSFKWYRGQYRTHADVNLDLSISCNSTLLHIAVMIESCEMIDLLLKYNADLYAKDVHGKTPIHLIIGARKPKLIATKLLSSPTTLKDVITDNGLSHLHVATVVDDTNAVERLLDQGTNVNQVQNDPLTYYTGYTPLGIAVEINCSNVIGRLIQRGADIFAKNPNDNASLLYRCFLRSDRWNLPHYVGRLKTDDAAQEYMTVNSGITMLHIACYMREVDDLRTLLKNGMDVNSVINENSELWPDSTPLHVLMMISCVSLRNDDLDLNNVMNMMQLLLDYGADVNLTDFKGNTPVHLASKTSSFDKNFARLSLLLKHQKSFNINPVSPENLSHFHLACLMNDTTAIKEYLKFDAPMNESVDFFCSYFPGCSPLHLTLTRPSADITSRLETMDYLLQNGADVNAEDSLGNTPFHSAVNCDSNRLDLFKKLYSTGGNIKAMDIFCKTPFESLLRSENKCTVEELEFFLKNGCTLNDFNPLSQTGYIGLIFSYPNENVSREGIYKMMTNFPELVKTDELDRTVIHNVVSTSIYSISDSNYVEIVRNLTKFGCDVDDQDELGKTPLHMAASLKNLSAVCGLLKFGADINITDNNGQTALSVTLDAYTQCEDEYKYDQYEVIEIFMTYLNYLEICGISVNEINKNTQTIAVEEHPVNAEKISNFHQDLNKVKNMKIGNIALDSFLSETEAATVYRNISDVERCAVDAFFQTIDESDLGEVICILNLLYRKALAKWSLTK